MSLSELAVLDRDHLLSMTGGDIELAVEVIEIFRHQTDMWLRMMDPQAPAEQWADAAHTLKGAALSVGAMRLARVCEVAEKLGRSGDASIAAAAVAISDVKDETGTALEAAAEAAHALMSSATRRAS